jgi:prevent-host-death family protein
LIFIAAYKEADMRQWQVQEAKARLSHLIREANQNGPQEITAHGRSSAVVMSREDFDRLSGQGESIVSFFKRSPLSGFDDLHLDQSRPKSPRRRPAVKL